MLIKRYDGFDLFPDPEKTYLDNGVLINKSGNIACFIVKSEVLSLVLMEGTVTTEYQRIYCIKDCGNGTLIGHIVDSKIARSGARKSNHICYELSEIKDGVLHYVVKERSREAIFAGVGFSYGDYNGGVWEIKKKYNLLELLA